MNCARIIATLLLASVCLGQTGSKVPKVHAAELVSVALRPDVRVVGGGVIDARDLEPAKCGSPLTGI